MKKFEIGDRVLYPTNTKVAMNATKALGTVIGWDPNSGLFSVEETSGKVKHFIPEVLEKVTPTSDVRERRLEALLRMLEVYLDFVSDVDTNRSMSALIKKVLEE